jgi:hypothetical protein
MLSTAARRPQTGSTTIRVVRARPCSARAFSTFRARGSRKHK